MSRNWNEYDGLVIRRYFPGCVDASEKDLMPIKITSKEELLALDFVKLFTEPCEDDKFLGFEYSGIGTAFAVYSNDKEPIFKWGAFQPLNEKTEKAFFEWFPKEITVSESTKQTK